MTNAAILSAINGLQYAVNIAAVPTLGLFCRELRRGGWPKTMQFKTPSLLG